jgi:hypothetical protein
MNVEPVITVSWDYLIELTDDGKETYQAEPEVIIIPPTPRAPGVPPASKGLPDPNSGNSPAI